MSLILNRCEKIISLLLCESFTKLNIPDNFRDLGI